MCYLIRWNTCHWASKYM